MNSGKCIIQTVKIKTMEGSLWSEMAHLTDSCLEAVKICQGGNRSWEVIPLDDCKWVKGVFVIIGPDIDLSVYERMGDS